MRCEQKCKSANIFDAEHGYAKLQTFLHIRFPIKMMQLKKNGQRDCQLVIEWTGRTWRRQLQSDALQRGVPLKGGRWIA